MINRDNYNLDYSKPIEIEEGIFWVGYLDKDYSLQCNPYLIIEGDEAVLLDGGSRLDFSTVMMKILQTGLNPSKIQKLIYHHYDPDLCGSIPDFEEIIENDDLRILSHRENNVFIKYYGGSCKRECVESLNYEYTFKTGRKLKFIRTPYSHSPGSFVTYDEKTGVLFSSDIFGSYEKKWELFFEINTKCFKCNDYSNCIIDQIACPFLGIIDFHNKIMTSGAALKLALDRIKKINPKIIAPQHGRVIAKDLYIEIIIKKIYNLKLIGIDKYIKEV